MTDVIELTRLHAQASADSMAPHDTADQTITLLHKAVQAGYHDADHLTREPRLARLGRQDFKDLPADLRKRANEN